MIGWELRELRLRTTKDNKISKSSQMRNKTNQEKKPEQKNGTKITQISPGEGLSKGLRGLMENSGDPGRDSARDSGELRGELRNSGNSNHSFWRTQEGTQGAPPLGIHNTFLIPAMPTNLLYLVH